MDWGNAFMALSDATCDTDLTSMRTKALLARLAAHEAARKAALLRLLQALRKPPAKRSPGEVHSITKLVPMFGPPLSSFTGTMAEHVARHMQLIELEEAGEPLCTSTDVADRCFAVFSGAVGVLDETDPQGELLVAKKFARDVLCMAEALQTAEAWSPANAEGEGEGEGKGEGEGEGGDSGGDGSEKPMPATFGVSVVSTEPARVLWLPCLEIRRVMFPHEFADDSDASAHMTPSQRATHVLGKAVMRRLGRLSDKEAAQLLDAMTPLACVAACVACAAGRVR